MKVAALTGGRNVPSARFRVRQYIRHLTELGIDMDELSGRTGAYPPKTSWQRPLWGAARLCEVSALAWRSRAYDCTLLQREMISSYVTLEPFTKKPRVVDVDDSVHLFRGGKVGRGLARVADRVIAGNSYLADWYSRWNSDVVVLPTGIDSDKYVPLVNSKSDPECVVVGWIGTSTNFPYLLQTEDALSRLMRDYPQLHLKVVSDIPPPMAKLQPARWSFVRWREATEISDIQSFDIGIMPLADSEWARGKCSFKMLQYMACGLPVVVSPVGMNAEVLVQGAVGISAETTDQWVEAIEALIRSPRIRLQMGKEVRALVERSYAAKVLAPRLAQYLQVN